MTGKKEKTHVLIIRLSAMGDVAMTVPVVRSLRESAPDIRITVLTRPFFKPFFRDIPDIEFLDADFKGRHKGPVGIYRLRNDIGAVGVTHTADLHDVLRTKVLRRLLTMGGVKVSVIDKGRDEKRELTRKFRKEKHQLKPTVERYAETVRNLGFDIPDPHPASRRKLPVPREILDMAGRKKGVWIGVAPFAQHKGKIYPTCMADELIGLLAAEYERVFVFGGGPYEQEFAEYMEQRHKGVVSVVGRIRLGAELDLISNLDAMVSMDSAAMHMASLMGVPVVSVWGATHPFAGFYGFGQDPEGAVQLDLHCRPCSVYGNKPCMYKDYRCLTGIAPQMIADKVAQVAAAGAVKKTPRKATRKAAGEASEEKAGKVSRPRTGSQQAARKVSEEVSVGKEKKISQPRTGSQQAARKAAGEASVEKPKKVPQPRTGPQHTGSPRVSRSDKAVKP